MSYIGFQILKQAGISDICQMCCVQLAKILVKNSASEFMRDADLSQSSLVMSSPGSGI